MYRNEDLDTLMTRARELSWENHGKRITFYVPGMFNYMGETGKYPAVSITGSQCELQCEHCSGKLLEPMISAPTPEQLVEKCRRLEEKGNVGVLLSGGSTRDGKLPWNEGFLEAIRQVKDSTGLFVSVHSGMLDLPTAHALKAAGIDQALIDVIGDDGTISKVYGGDFGLADMEATLVALGEAGIPTIPHLIVGLDGGKITGEYTSIDIIKGYSRELLVIVSFMPLPGTPMARSAPPDAVDVARIASTARLEMPDTPISLGCARERGNTRLDTLAIDSGVNRMAIPADEAIERAKEYGLEITWEKTCCSVPGDRGGG